MFYICVLANVHVLYMSSSVRLSSVTFVRLTQAIEIFGNFYAMWYLGHPGPLYKNFTEIVPGEPLRRGS